MSDTQSFPFQSKTHPELWSGAFSSVERYTQLDARAVVEYARLRGVRVIVEFDQVGKQCSICRREQQSSNRTKSCYCVGSLVTLAAGALDTPKSARGPTACSL
jgi:hypothetical protein